MEVNKLTKLQRFKSRGFQYYRKSVTHINGREMEIGWMKYANLSFTDLIISDLGFICQDDATEAELKNMECLSSLTLQWLLSPEHKEVEVLEALHPPNCLSYFALERYPGISLPSWFQPQNLQNITSLRLSYGNRLESISVSRTMQQISRTEMPTISDNTSNVFSSLTDLIIE